MLGGGLHRHRLVLVVAAGVGGGGLKALGLGWVGGAPKEPLLQPPSLWQGLFGQAAKKGPSSHTSHTHPSKGVLFGITHAPPVCYGERRLGHVTEDLFSWTFTLLHAAESGSFGRAFVKVLCLDLVPSTHCMHSTQVGSLVTSNRDQGPCSYPGRARASACAASQAASSRQYKCASVA